MGSAPKSTTGYRYYVLGILIVVYTLNFLDRQILSILVEPIKKDLDLSDSQIGLMSGLAFAVLYSTLGIPIAWLADRTSRRRIMAAALAVWSGFTALCGLTTSFWQLFAARVGVGVGEAGGVAPAYSMISDYFPKTQRARALALYSLGIPVGSAAGILFGGLIASAISWRAAFKIVGSAGVVLAPILLRTVRDPHRGGYDASGQPVAAATPPRFADVFAIIAPKSTFWLLSFGAALSSVCGYGIAFWLPSFLKRSLLLTDIVDRSLFASAMTLGGGCLGIFLGGWIADRAGARSKSAYPQVPAFAFLIALPCLFFAVNTSSLVTAFPLFMVATGLNLAWLGPILTAVQHLVPAHMRTTASACFLMINSLLGIAVGNYYFGAVSDAFKPYFGDDSLRYALYSGLGFYVLSSILFLIASKTIRRHWVE